MSKKINKPFCFVLDDEFKRSNRLWILHADGETYQLFEDGYWSDEALAEDLERWGGEFLSYDDVATRLAATPATTGTEKE